MAARALGLDCGRMSGFDNAKVDEEFFAAGKPCFGCDQGRQERRRSKTPVGARSSVPRAGD
jgi:nitroreductase